MNTQTRLSAKGQVVIPKDVRDRLGLAEGTVFDVIERDGEIVLKQESASKSGMTAEQALREVQSFYCYDGPRLSVDEMREAVRESVVERFRRRNSS